MFILSLCLKLPENIVISVKGGKKRGKKLPKMFNFLAFFAKRI